MDESVDVVGEILDAAHLATAVFGRLELGAPYRLRVPARSYLSFYVVARGGGWIEIERPAVEEAEGRGPMVLALSSGDALLLPHGSAHTLKDAERSAAEPQGIDYLSCRRPWFGGAEHFGGGGPATTLVTGHFTFSGSASRNPLLGTLPLAIHLPADAIAASPQLSGVVPLILSESARPGPGATVVLARLADLLLIHALRYWIATASVEECGLRAVADPVIGAALRLIHARAAEPWTVEGLAAEVAMSRSAFAARFTT
ncbi:MAG TPA: cupin domain-containing protein, partial [Longimicrobiales bacterium]|nr:cupin domain-containing protein [Longimicrobiales bacterium]